MKINPSKVKLLGIALILSFVVAVAGCTEKAATKEPQATEAPKVETAPPSQVETAPKETPAPAPEAPMPSFKTYRHTHYNIDYPSNWDIVDMTDGAEAFVSGLSGPDDDLDEKVLVSLELENTYTNLDQYVSVSLKQLKVQYAGIKILENTKTTLAKQPARKLVYTYETENLGVVKVVQIVSIKDAKSYVVTYGGKGNDFDKYWPYAQKMIDSFVMKE